MNTKNKKIAAACFAGAAVCGALLAMLSPAFAWLGFLSGACVGYVGYEFRAFWRAVPVALSDAWGGVWRVAARVVAAVRPLVSEIRDELVSWMIGPHPIAKISSACAVLFGGWVTFLFWHEDVALNQYLLVVIVTVAFFVACVCALNVIVAIGQRREKECVEVWHDHIEFFAPFAIGDKDRFTKEGSYQAHVSKKIIESGFKPVEPTVWNVLRWVAFAPLVITRSLWNGSDVFFRTMFHLIHSSERVICALDSVIGGALGWWLLRGDPSAPIWLVSACCGAIGAAVGLLHARLAEWLVARARIAAA